jgi:hypothetical protein
VSVDASITYWHDSLNQDFEGLRCMFTSVMDFPVEDPVEDPANVFW